jgi:predicted esterase
MANSFWRLIVPEYTYEQLAEELTSLFEKGEYSQSLALANKYLSEYPERIAHLNYIRMCSAAGKGDRELSIAILSDMLDRGLWYSEELLKRSPSLADLQNDPVFQELLSRSMAIKGRMFGEDQTLMVLHDTDKCTYATPEEGESCPILVALHSNGEMLNETIAGWKSAAQLGWLVAIPKSSKSLWAGGGHFWINHHEASSEIFNQISPLQGNYNYDEDRIVIGGHAMGGEIALWMALQGMLNAVGFILLAPFGPHFNDPIRWKHLIEDAQGANLRGAIMVGEDEQRIPLDIIRTTIALLNEHGIDTKTIMFKGGQIYPSNFAQHLKEAIAFIIK